MDKTKINKIVIVAAALVVSIMIFYYFEGWLYFSDKYLWYVSLGQKYFEKIGDKDRALKYADMAFDINQERPEAHRLMAAAFLKKGLFNKSQEEISSLRVRGHDAYYYFGMGLISLEQKKFDPSIPYLNKSMENCSSNAVGHLMLSLAYFGLGDLASALNYLNRSKAIIEGDSKKSLQYKKIQAGIHLLHREMYQKENMERKAKEEFEISKSYYSWKISPAIFLMNDLICNKDSDKNP